LEIEEKKLFGIRDSINYYHIKKTLEEIKERERQDRNLLSTGFESWVEKLLHLFSTQELSDRKEIVRILKTSERTVSRKMKIFLQLDLVGFDNEGYFAKPRLNRFLEELTLDDSSLKI